jgi:hypothetical protein
VGYGHLANRWPLLIGLAVIIAGAAATYIYPWGIRLA